MIKIWRAINERRSVLKTDYTRFMDFKHVQFPPLKFKEYTWHGVPEAFDEMLMNPERPDLLRYLKMLGMEKYDIWEFLKRTKGRSETNNWFLDTDDSGIKLNMVNKF